MNRKDAILEDLKRVASDLGHAPTRAEYAKHGRFPKDALTDEFGGHTLALTAAGLEPNRSAGPKRLKAAEVFKADVEETVGKLREIVSIKIAPPVTETGRRILVIGDTHFPFVSVNGLTALYAYAEWFMPTDIVQVGDLFDQLAASRFPKSQNFYTPDQEIDLARRGAETMWQTFTTIAPQAKKVQLLGNHDIRPMKAIMEAWGPGERAVRNEMERLYTFPGVETIFDPRQEHRIDDVLFLHGYMTQLGAHARHNGMCTVVGHTHRGGVLPVPLFGRSRLVWELNPGYLGDPTTKALGYTPQRFNHWTLGGGSIDDYGARFVGF